MSSIEQQVQGNNTQIIECHDCSLSLLIPTLQHKQEAHCPRCGLEITHFHQSNVDYILAFSFTALLFLFATLHFPFLSFSVKDQSQQIDIIHSLTTLINYDYIVLASLEIIAIFIIPVIILCGLIYLLIPIRLTRSPPPFSANILRLIFILLPWSMAEIFLVGTLVSLVKITSLADVSLGIAFYMFILFSIFMVATTARLDKIQLHKRLKITPHHAAKKKPHSKQYVWALLITATILYIPANVLPIMTTRLLGRDEPSTILGGVELLWQHGSKPIAIVIFIASILIPIAKIIALAWLNYSVQTKSNAHHKQRIIIYRIAEFLGRWSMIDVFVVTILVSLIQLGNTMTVYPGPAAFAFSAVVIVTMLAAISFDSHLIWCPDKHQIDNRLNNGNIAV